MCLTVERTTMDNRQFKIGDIVRLQPRYGRIGLYESMQATVWGDWMFASEVYVVIDLNENFIHAIHTASGKQGWCGKTFVQRVA